MSRSAAVLPLLALLALLGLAQASVPAGDRLVDQGDFRGAMAQYQRVLDRDPDDAHALARLARAETYYAATLEGRAAAEIYEQAAQHARAAVAADPDNLEAHFELARSLGRLAEFKGVLQSLGLASEMQDELELVLERDPRHGGALHALALWNLNVPWIAGGRRGRVKPLFERAIEAEPDVITHRVDYGEALIELGDRAGARAQLEAALALPARTHLDRQHQQTARSLLAGL